MTQGKFYGWSELKDVTQINFCFIENSPKPENLQIVLVLSSHITVTVISSV